MLYRSCLSFCTFSFAHCIVCPSDYHYGILDLQLLITTMVSSNIPYQNIAFFVHKSWSSCYTVYVSCFVEYCTKYCLCPFLWPFYEQINALKSSDYLCTLHKFHDWCHAPSKRILLSWSSWTHSCLIRYFVMIVVFVMLLWCCVVYVNNPVFVLFPLEVI